MDICVTGYEGRLGSELVHRGCIPLGCDITVPESIDEALKSLDRLPEVIINCAAYTDVDEAEEEYDIARAVNTWGFHKITNAFSGDVIQISTDYIFSGDEGPYSEEAELVEDEKRPINAYGWSKWGADILASQLENCYVVRTTGLYGGISGKHDFYKLVKDHLASDTTLKVTDELFGNQTYVPHLAQALIQYAEMKDRPKVVNIASSNVLSRYDFAFNIANKLGGDFNLLIKVRNKDVPTWVADRPTYGGLTTGLAKEIGLPIYSTWKGLELACQE